MTRFARAKGSKASNLKAPEDGTPWEVMKEQLLKAKKETEESKKRAEAEQQRINNYENFLKERRVEKRKAEWCDFPETQAKKNNVENKTKTGEKAKNKISAELQKSVENEPIEDNSQESNLSKKKKNKKKNVSKNTPHDVNTESNTNITEETVSNNNSQKKINNKSNFIEPTLNDNSSKLDNTIQGDIGKKKKNKNKTNQDVAVQDSIKSQTQNGQSNDNTKKNKKKTGEVPVRRKEINERSFKLIINGKDIELVRFDGFPIMKRDAERLQELKNNMIKKGIPKSEVQRTIKLERRRAEKALARLKRDVCYNCRKGGHNLSDCPDLKSNIPGVDSADGVCFKCGSMEHRQNECKVQRDKEFRFATCFICREPGHLARQCPDNPKGLYPNGGCCKLCGDVTHLRKDCPTVTEKKEGTSIKLPTLDETDNIEDIGQSAKPLSEEPAKKPKKVRF